MSDCTTTTSIWDNKNKVWVNMGRKLSDKELMQNSAETLLKNRDKSLEESKYGWMGKNWRNIAAGIGDQ